MHSGGYCKTTNVAVTHTVFIKTKDQKINLMKFVFIRVLSPHMKKTSMIIS